MSLISHRTKVKIFFTVLILLSAASLLWALVEVWS